MIAAPTHPDFPDVSDDVRAAQRGDRDAFGRLYVAFWPTVYAYAMNVLRNPHDAQELAQDVLTHALQKLGQLRYAAAFPGWLRRITKHMAVNRVLRRGAKAFGDDGMLDATPARTPSPVENLINREDAEQVRRGLDRLNPMDRETLIAYYFRGQSIDQISREIDAPIGTIKRRLHVARNRLRRELERRNEPRAIGA